MMIVASGCCCWFFLLLGGGLRQVGGKESKNLFVFVVVEFDFRDVDNYGGEEERRNGFAVVLQVHVQTSSFTSSIIN